MFLYTYVVNTSAFQSIPPVNLDQNTPAHIQETLPSLSEEHTTSQPPLSWAQSWYPQQGPPYQSPPFSAQYPYGMPSGYGYQQPWQSQQSYYGGHMRSPLGHPPGPPSGPLSGHPPYLPSSHLAGPPTGHLSQELPTVLTPDIPKSAPIPTTEVSPGTKRSG